MADQKNKNVDALAQEITLKSRGQGKLRQFILWMGALIIGAILGWQHIPALNELFNFLVPIHCDSNSVFSGYYYIIYARC